MYFLHNKAATIHLLKTNSWLAQCYGSNHCTCAAVYSKAAHFESQRNSSFGTELHETQIPFYYE